MPHPNRSATASIRGYLYQTVLAAQAWVSLADGETLVVEGDEDFDLVLKGEQTSVQVKDRAETVVSLATPSLQTSIHAFARTFAEKDGKVRFVYVTTQSRKAPLHDVDPVGQWVEGEEGGHLGEVASAVAKLAREKRWKGPLPKGKKSWRAFVGSVRFEFDRGGVDQERNELNDLLRRDLQAAGLVETGLSYRILDSLWDASSRDDLGLRRKTRRDLDELIEEARLSLADWARTEPAKHLVSWVDTAAALEKVLPTFTRPLTHPDLPSQLLDARYEVVPFDDAARAREIRLLSKWCERKPRLDVRVIVGSGGTGKTRLLLELCKRYGAAGWHAGFLDIHAKPDDVDALGGGRGNRLVVVDYAETRLDVARAILQAVESSKARCRVVLLAREDGPWLESLRTGDAVLGQLVRGNALRLHPLAPEPGEARAEAFRKMVHAFATARGVAVPDPLPTVHLDRKEMDSALLLAMAALEASRDPDDGEIRPERLLQTTLEHEQRFWERWLRDRGIPEVRPRHLKAVEEAVAAFTLVGRWRTEEEVEACLACIFGLRRSDPDLNLPLLTDLAGDLYRGRTGEFVTALQPDLLGEHLVRRVLFRLSGSGPWLDTVLRGVGSDQLTQAFTVLGRIGADLGNAEHRSRLEEWLGNLLDADFCARARPAFQAAVGLGTQTAFAPVAKALAEAMGPRVSDEREVLAAEIVEVLNRTELTPVSLRELAVVCGEILLAELQANDGNSADLARHLNDLGVRQSALGQREAALASTAKAVEIRRRLAQERPDTFLPDLAMSLNNLGTMQSRMGQNEAASESIREAIQILRDLARVRPGKFSPDLAMFLSNLGLVQVWLGLFEVAIKSSQEAVSRYRDLAEERPREYLPELARSINNLGLAQKELGEHESALKSTQKAVHVWRELAKERPDESLPDLAMSLSNLGMMQSALGLYEAAIDSSQEATQVYRELAQERPDAFLSSLATSLNNLGLVQEALGLHESAIESTKEAVETQKVLARERPSLFLPKLARSWGAYGVALQAAGEGGEAAASFRKGLDLVLPFAAQLPVAFRGLSLSLANKLDPDENDDLIRQVRDIYGEDAI